jgi:hypothetical protein
MLFNVERLDMLAFAAMSAVMPAVALLAGYVPARRARSCPCGRSNTVADRGKGRLDTYRVIVGVLVRQEG